MRALLALLAGGLCACAGGGHGDVLIAGPSKALTRLAVAGVSGPGALGGEGAARALAAALNESRFDAVAAADADSVVSSAELGLSGASPGTLAELRRATGAEAVVFATVAPDGASLELAVLETRNGDVLRRVRVRSRGERFASAREAAVAGAAALAPLAKGKRGKASAPELDELPPP